MPQATAVLETSLYVDDLAQAERFYAEVLGLSVHSGRPDRHVFFRMRRQMLLLFLAEATEAEPSETPSHGARGPGHVAFEAQEEELEAWRRKLAQCGVPIEHETQWPNGGHSIYFRDPSGNSLELATPRLWFENNP